MAATLRILLLALVLAGAPGLAPWAARAAEVPIPPSPTRWVTDTAGFLSPATARALDEKLDAYQRQTGRQIIVWIGRTTGDTPLEEWVVRAFERWKVGRKGIDDGAALFVMADDRKLRFEIGYGLEGTVPDVVASRIIRDVMVPRIQAGDRDGAVVQGVDSLLAAIEGKPWGAHGGAGSREGVRHPGGQQVGLGQMIFFGIAALVFLFILITNPSLALYLLFVLSSGGRGGYGGRGGGGGGGGFSGGGGRSGGGGASGSW